MRQLQSLRHDFTPNTARRKIKAAHKDGMVRIMDDCYWPDDEREERIIKANREILRIVAEAMQNDQVREDHG